MTPSTPRWEWRTFASDFGTLDARIRAASTRRRESCETYIVSDRPDTNTKIREELLDVKALQQVDSRGLERWMPMVKAAFPIASEALPAVFDGWGLPVPRLRDRTWTIDEFLDDLVRRQPSLAVIEVTKTRYGTVVDGCDVEVADLSFDGIAQRTVAIEQADAGRVWRTVRALGLSTYENVSYVKALKRFVAVHSS